jgi:hypothetical protein
VHAAIFALLGMLWRTAPASGVRGEPDRGVGIAVFDSRRAAPEYVYEPADAVGESLPPLTAAAEALPAQLQAPEGGAPRLPMPGDAGPLAADTRGLPAADALTSDGRPSRTVGGQTTTGVFGVTGTGSRFVYVFDRSSSMEGYGGRPLRAARQQLTSSLAGLDDTHQFQIVFYNDRTSVFNPNAPQPPRLMYGDEQTKRLAENFVNGIAGSGGTLHYDALRIALGMHPDVIFLLTDGAENPISPSQLQRLETMNQRIGASINTIEFGVGPGGRRYNFLVRLAEQNNGQYAYVDVTVLP